MTPLSLRLVNWWRHVDTQLQFTGDMIGLLGPNGCGKSAVVSALSYLLTGSTPRVKQRNLRWGADSGFVEGVFEHAGQRFTVRRNVATAACQLSMAGSEPLTRSDDVNRFLQGMLGITPRVFTNHVVVAQGELDALVTMQRSALTQDLQSLFGTERCEKIREHLHKRIVAHTVSDADQRLARVIDEIATSQADILTCTTQLQFLDANLAGSQLEWAHRCLSDAAAWQEKGPLCERLQQQIKELQAQLAADELQLTQNRTVVEQLHAHVVTQRPIVAQYEKHLSMRAAYDQKVTELMEAQARLAAAQQTIQALNDDPITANPEDESSLTQMAQELAGPVHAASMQLQQLQSLGSVCPTCKQTIPNRDEIMQRLQASLAVDGPRLQRINSELAALRQRNAELAQRVAHRQHNLAVARGALQSWEETIAVLERSLAGLQVPGVAVDPATMQSTIQAFNVDLQRLTSLQTQLHALEAANDQRRQSLNMQQTTLASITLPETRPDSTQVAAAQAAVRQHAEWTTQRGFYVGTLQEKQRALSVLMNTRQSLEVEVELDTRRRSFKHDLEQIHELLHRDKLPWLMAQSYQRRVNDMFAHILTQMQFPFTARLNDEQVFECLSPDGHVFFGDELSGGQKQAFCLAFRLATNLQFAGHVGLLILDEPTAYVDSDNVRHIAEVLESMRSFVRSLGVRVMVVTHEPALIPSFDQVIDVAALQGAV